MLLQFSEHFHIIIFYVLDREGDAQENILRG